MAIGDRVHEAFSAGLFAFNSCGSTGSALIRLPVAA
jgi:hypothetical protein